MINEDYCIFDMKIDVFFKEKINSKILRIIISFYYPICYYLFISIRFKLNTNFFVLFFFFQLKNEILKDFLSDSF